MTTETSAASQSVYDRRSGEYVGEIEADAIVRFGPEREHIVGSRANVDTLYVPGPSHPSQGQVPAGWTR